MTELTNIDFWVFALAGIAGMLFHWGKRWLRRQTSSSLYAYLFKAHPRYTAYALLTYVGLIAMMVFTGVVDDYGSKEALILAASTGYGIDSAINKDFESDEIHSTVRDRF